MKSVNPEFAPSHSKNERIRNISVFFSFSEVSIGVVVLLEKGLICDMGCQDILIVNICYYAKQ